jgi:hypothetical protein
MTKIISGLICLLMFYANIYAQPNVLYSSNSFPEPVDGWKQLLILKNGNTCYLHLTAKGMQVTIYGTDGKSISTTSNTYTNYTKGKSLFKDGRFVDMFESNGNIVLMASYEEGCGLGGFINCVQLLYRFVFDGRSGKLTTADYIGATEKVKGYGYDLDQMVMNNIYVKKDETSGWYAVLLHSGYNIKTDSAVKLYVYDDGHQIVKKVVLKDYPDAKDVKYCGMDMYNKNVYLVTNEYDPKQKKSLKMPVKFSVLKDGSNEFETKTLSIQPFTITSDNTLVYNKNLQTLILITTSETDSKYKYNLSGGKTTKYYATMITQVDPATFTIISTKPYTGEAADIYARNQLKQKNGFNGILPSVHINKDNTVTLIPEEQYEVTRSTGRSTYTTTYVDKIALVNLNSEGKEEDAAVLRIREVSGARTFGRASGGYYEYRYANTGKSSYIIMNDLDENFDKTPESKLHAITSISDANTIVYHVKNGSVQKSYMFGKPDNKRATRFSMVGDATFDEATNTYATIVVNGENKQARIAWVKLD